MFVAQRTLALDSWTSEAIVSALVLRDLREHRLGLMSHAKAMRRRAQQILVPLPLDLLSEVLQHLEGRSIGRLWLCGSSQLQYSLANCVKRFELLIDSIYPSQWPSLVSHFPRLEEFSIHRVKEGLAEDEWIPNYSDLSQSLRRLNLLTTADFKAFMETLRSGHSFPHLEELTGISAGHSMSVFELVDARNLAETAASFASFLPSSLKVLTIHKSTYFPLAPCYWPKQLRKTNIFATEQGSLEIMTLPETLEEVSITLHSDQITSFQWPPNLLTLTLRAQIKPGFAVDVVRQLPRSLTSLDLDDTAGYAQVRSTELIKALPPDLTDLSLKNILINPNMLDLLPKSLTKFPELPWPDFDTIKLFPPNLTELNGCYHHPDIYASLPSSLRILSSSEDYWDDADAEVNWPKLPDTLTSMDFVEPSYLAQHPFPAQLNELLLYAMDITAEIVDRWSTSNITDLTLQHCHLTQGVDSLFSLPRKLKRLVMLNMNSKSVPQAPHLKSFPSTLTELVLGGAELQAYPDPLKCLPRGLKKLHFSATTLNVGCLGKKGVCIFPELVDLSMTLSSMTEGLEEHIFAHLPRKLKYFSFLLPQRKRMDITDETLSSLPRGLVDMTLSPATTNLTGTWLSKRPPALKRLCIGQYISLRSLKPH